MNDTLSFNYRQIIIIVGIAIGIIATSFVFELYYLAFLPLAFFIALGFFFKPDLLFFTLAFVTPLSINPADAELGKLSVSIPSEPIAVILVMMFALLVITSDKVDKNFLKHPISLIIYLYFIWLGVTCITSVDKIVSIKFIIAKTWFIIPCYFLAGVFFRDLKHIYHYLFLFVIGMTLIASYNVIHLSFFGFEDKASQWTMQPFFKDHTILGAVIAITIPLSLGLIKMSGKDIVKKSLLFLFFIILSVCLVVTYSRAAWASVIPAIVLFLVFYFRIGFKWVLTVFIIVFSYLFMNIETIIMDMERNKIAGSDDLIENAESISNISSDPSNLERINRWSSAIEMWKAKPVFGWGPGTYMFEYAPFQLKRNYTSISTNFGDVGNAHSEYLGPLAESGLPGLLIFISLLFLTFYIAFRAYANANEKIEKVIISTASCALITYFTHGFLNNFLDTDKASNIFWPLMTVIVILDLRTKQISSRYQKDQ
jgi:putative inorganic carbon (hco3(-)) transporter